MPKEIVIIGAGKIGRGVAGLLFARDGWKLHLYDMYMEGMRQLEAQGYYDVHVTNGHDVNEKICVSDFDIVDSSTSDEIVEMLSHVDLAACCVYAGAFESVAGVIAEAVRCRVMRGRDAELNVLLCVNALGAPEQISSYVADQLEGDALSYFNEHVGICQVMVLAAGIPSEPDANPWQVVVSANPGLEIDADAWRGERVSVPNVSYVQGAQAHMYRKVYCGNMRHAMAGFLGKYRGLEFICDCNKDPWIRENIVRAFDEAHGAVLQEFSFDPAEDAGWVSFIEAKLDDDTKDPVDRVIDKADEKLSHGNRFVGPALMCLRHGIVPFYLTRGIAYGLNYMAVSSGCDPRTLEEARAYVGEVCELSEDEWLVRDLVAKHYLDSFIN